MCPLIPICGFRGVNNSILYSSLLFLLLSCSYTLQQRFGNFLENSISLFGLSFSIHHVQYLVVVLTIFYKMDERIKQRNLSDNCESLGSSSSLIFSFHSLIMDSRCDGVLNIRAVERFLRPRDKIAKWGPLRAERAEKYFYQAR